MPDATGDPRARQAFTLIEALVVIAIIGLLAGLIVPAVQLAREASHRAECMNHLKQIGLAVTQFEASHGSFPPGMRRDGVDDTGRIYGLGPVSAQCLILPYLEEVNLFNLININLNPTNPEPPLVMTDSAAENRTAANTVVAAYLCPSDEGLSPGINYRACFGWHPNTHDGTPWPGGGGAFPGFVPTSRRDYRDGLSQTIGFSERIRSYGSGHRYSRDRDVWFSGLDAVSPYADSDEVRGVCQAGSGPTPPEWTQVGATWISGGSGNTLYNHASPPNWKVGDCSTDEHASVPGDFSSGVITARSNHPGGVHALLMDGSVRFVQDGMNLAGWRALATRSGSEAISADSY